MIETFPYYLMPNGLLVSLSVISYALVLFIIGLIAWCVITEQFENRKRARQKRIRRLAIIDLSEQLLTESEYTKDQVLKLTLKTIAQGLNHHNQFSLEEIERNLMMAKDVEIYKIEPDAPAPVGSLHPMEEKV